MKVIVFSDSHGNFDLVRRLIDFNDDADYIISLGDSGLSEEFFQVRDIVHVKGNIMRDPGAVYHAEVTIDGFRIFITHGHKFKVHKRLDKLIQHGVSNDFNAVLFGHTHVAHYEISSGMHVINPGSCVSPRNDMPPSYAILDIVDKECSVTFKDVMTNRTIEV